MDNQRGKKMTYLELENLYKKEICLFGAGHVGKTTGYEFAVNFLMQIGRAHV